MQAPTGRTSWQFLVVMDEAKKVAVAGYYKDALSELRAMNPDSGPGKPSMHVIHWDTWRRPFE